MFNLIDGIVFNLMLSFDGEILLDNGKDKLTLKFYKSLKEYVLYKNDMQVSIESRTISITSIAEKLIELGFKKCDFTPVL